MQVEFSWYLKKKTPALTLSSFPPPYCKRTCMRALRIEEWAVYNDNFKVSSTGRTLALSLWFIFITEASLCGFVMMKIHQSGELHAFSAKWTLRLQKHNKIKSTKAATNIRQY